MKNLYLLIVVMFMLLTSCHKKDYDYVLVKTEKGLSFQIDNQTKNSPKALFTYKDDSGKEYLTFQNPDKNEILFYDLKDEKFDFKTIYDIEGANGVGYMWGYYIHNLDSIFLTSRDLSEIYLTDKSGKVYHKYLYEMTKDSTTLGIYCSISFLSIPAVIKDDNFYIMPSCNRRINPNPMCAVIDLKTDDVHALPYSYPIFPNTDNKMKRAGIELYVSRCLGDNKFVYSFYFDEDLYVADIEHENVEKIKAKSRYFNQVTVPDDYGGLTFKDMCEIPNYGNILFDKYRNVYYRIAYPKTEIDKTIRPLELMDFGRKNFSILILDADFNVIGETLFPDYTYNSTLMFVGEDGLYISDSHSLNPAFSDDVLSFKLFKLTKE